MGAGDGTVDIRVTGSVDPSVQAAANEAKAAIGGMGDATAKASYSAKEFAAALAANNNNVAKAVAALEAARAAKAADAAVTGTETAATVANTAATTANTAATINSRAAYETMVLVHEALQGRFTRMAGSSMILTQALAGNAAVANALAWAMTGAGAAILGTVAVLGAATVANIQYENSQEKLLATSIGLAAQSGLTRDQLQAAGEAAANWASESEREATKAAEAFAAAGVKDQQTLTELSASVRTYADLTGVKFADAQKTLAQAMQDPIKGAEELHQQLGILDGDQINQIRQLVELGEKDKAVAILTQALKQRLDEANSAGVGAAGAFGQVANALSNLWSWAGKADVGLQGLIETMSGMGFIMGPLRAKQEAHAQAIEHTVHAQAALNDASAKGAAAFQGTPEAEAIQRKTELIGKLHDLQKAMQADIQLHGANSEAVKRDKQGIEDYTHAVTTFLTPVEKKLKADQLDVQLAAAKHAHNKQLVADLTEQKALLQEAGKVESTADARALAKGSGEVAGARTFAPKGRKAGGSIVSEWEEQLHQAEVASNNFFADETEFELKFWEGKLAQTKKGSKEWLEVQTKIYDAQKQLARRDYQEHIADLNDRLEADRDDFKKFQSDWAEKLAYIKSKFGEESTEYKDAHRQMLAEERQFQDRMIREELTGNNKQIEGLKQSLQAQQQIRQQFSQIMERSIQDKAGTSPFGDISAATRIGQLHHQLMMEEIADAEKAYQAENTLREKGLADALRVYGQDDQRYKNAVIDKQNADKAYYDKKRQLELQSLNQQLQDIQRLKAAYHQYIDGTVNATVSGFANMLDGTGTWRDAVIGIYNSIKSAAEQVIEQIIEHWIVNLLIGKSQQSAVAQGQVLSYAGVAGAAGVASFAAAPWPIDMGAPAFGASMSQAALAFAPLAALDVGTNYMPRDQIVQMHEGERVIPKADNSKLIQMMAVATGGTGGRPSELHLHSSPVFNGNQASLWQHMVDKHEREMLRWMKRQFINGPLRPAA